MRHMTTVERREKMRTFREMNIRHAGLTAATERKAKAARRERYLARLTRIYNERREQNG